MILLLGEKMSIETESVEILPWKKSPFHTHTTYNIVHLGRLKFLKILKMGIGKRRNLKNRKLINDWSVIFLQ